MAYAGFFLVAVMIVMSALGAVSLRSIFHAALSLAVMLLSVAALYLMLSAEFLAVAQILIYVGAIMTLILFAVMLTARIADPTVPQHNEERGAAALIAAALGAILLAIVWQTPWASTAPQPPITLAGLGRELLTTYALPFETISVALVAALIGAMVIAKREET